MHKFEINEEKFTLPIQSEQVQFIGAVQCIRCGLRAPYTDRSMGELILHIMNSFDETVEDDCNTIIVEKVMGE